MLDDVDDVFGAALAKLGYLYNSANPDELRKAQKEVSEALSEMQRSPENFVESLTQQQQELAED